MGKITLELGGKYSAGEMIQRAQTDMKKLGQKTKDIGSIGVQSFNSLAGSINGPASKAFKGFSSLLTGFATGGIFGLVASAAGIAFDFIGSKINEAIEKAERFREALVTGVMGGVQKIADKSADIYKGFADAKKQGDTATARKIEQNNTSQKRYEADVDL